MLCLSCGQITELITWITCNTQLVFLRFVVFFVTPSNHCHPFPGHKTLQIRLSHRDWLCTNHWSCIQTDELVHSSWILKMSSQINLAGYLKEWRSSCFSSTPASFFSCAVTKKDKFGNPRTKPPRYIYGNSVARRDVYPFSVKYSPPMVGRHIKENLQNGYIQHRRLRIRNSMNIGFFLSETQYIKKRAPVVTSKTSIVHLRQFWKRIFRNTNWKGLLSRRSNRPVLNSAKLCSKVYFSRHSSPFLCFH